MRAETIAAANELLLNVHPARMALGDGHIATVDGMRFGVPVRWIHAGPTHVTRHRPRCDMAELHERPVAGPHAIVADQAAYSDQVFGLHWLLGYQFSPRPASLPDQRFWYFARDSDYGALQGIARSTPR